MLELIHLMLERTYRIQSRAIATGPEVQVTYNSHYHAALVSSLEGDRMPQAMVVECIVSSQAMIEGAIWWKRQLIVELLRTLQRYARD